MMRVSAYEALPPNVTPPPTAESTDSSAPLMVAAPTLPTNWKPQDVRFTCCWIFFQSV